MRAISTAFWSEWGDSNSRLRHPKCRALPTGLHPDILLFFLWFSGPFFAVFSVYGRACGQRQKQWIGKSRFSQCFRHFLPLCSNGTDFSRSSQSTRAINCATPGYSIFLFCRCSQPCSQTADFGVFTEVTKRRRPSLCRELREFRFLVSAGSPARSRAECLTGGLRTESRRCAGERCTSGGLPFYCTPSQDKVKCAFAQEGDAMFGCGGSAHFTPQGSTTFAHRKPSICQQEKRGVCRQGRALAANGLAPCGDQTDDHKARQAPRNCTENRTLAAPGASAYYFFASARHTLVPARAMANVNQKMHITRG